MVHALLLVGLVLCANLPAEAPSRPSQVAEATVEPAFIGETVEALGTALRREYFDPVVASRVSGGLQRRLAEGRYQRVSTLESLAKTLTDDLYAMTNDKHLQVSIAPVTPPGAVEATAAANTPREVTARRANFGIQRIEILPGNVGYLHLTAFYRPNEAREAIASAMAILRHTDALILDLRDNGGGSSGTLALMASYFCEAQGLPLFDVVPRPPGKVTTFTTEATALQDRNERRPTYVLVSGNTWSAGEGLAFLLQERHRAEVIGEVTQGAGNQAQTHRLNSRFDVTIPNGSVRTAIRNQSWEGKGVLPDIPATSSDSLRIAHTRALQRLLKSAHSGTWRDALESHLRLLEGR
ncbi:interphotoreceptor retinoid-binding protein [Geothrix limicola]|uniref:Interphotoreceptor retinoid-binding protein n=1 Tax=Geothrix limicola TaxID=2927978 RepID=A0ABQ5QBV9_9BACT|nr:S41 family peptidase [Geothrix limicola]GLH72307.1 interphotoreceptor retinoid-binding protein [Geothrix limicola]